MDDGIECKVRLWSVEMPYQERTQHQRYQFKIGDSCGQAVIGQEWILGPRGALARVDGGDPGDENDSHSRTTP